MGCLESASRLDEAASSGELRRYIDEYIEELQREAAGEGNARGIEGVPCFVWREGGGSWTVR